MKILSNIVLVLMLMMPSFSQGFYQYKVFQPTPTPKPAASIYPPDDGVRATNRIRRPYAYNNPLYFPYVQQRNQNNYDPTQLRADYSELIRSKRREILRRSREKDHLPFSFYSRDYYQDYSNNRIGAQWRERTRR